MNVDAFDRNLDVVPKDIEVLECEKCDFVTNSTNEFEEHIQLKH